MVTKLEQIRGLGRSEVERRMAGGAVGAVRAVLPKVAADAAKIETLQARIRELEAALVPGTIPLAVPGTLDLSRGQKCPVCEARRLAERAKKAKARTRKVRGKSART